MNNGITARTWNGVAIRRRQSDGFVNATAMCKANDKRFNDYLRLDRTRAYLCALEAQVLPQKPCGAAVAGNPVTGSGLIEIRQGGRPEDQGTWVHPYLALDLARWLAPAFAVWMDGWFLGALGSAEAPQAPPQEVRTPRAHELSDVSHVSPPSAPTLRASAAPGPLPATAELMSHEELRSISGHLTALLAQRQQGDPLANDLIRAFAQHLLLSCDALPLASQLIEAMDAWRVGMRIKTAPSWERNMLLRQWQRV